jgi:hypothetical protein
MEVHHHSHHPKKWKEYITEFLMLFLAVSMGFVAENLREKHIEKERSEELIQAFVIDIKENQKQLDSLIIKNQKSSNYFDSLSINHATINQTINLLDLAHSLDFWVYRFINRNTIFEQMKSSGALRYIHNKEVLNAILQYEQHAALAETRSMESETQQYFNEFRPGLQRLLPPSFFIIRGLSNGNPTINIARSKRIEVHPGFIKNYMLHDKELHKQLQDTKLSIAQIRELSQLWIHREERLELSLISQIGLRVEGKKLLQLLEHAE